jgi:hypothetical protein
VEEKHLILLLIGALSIVIFLVIIVVMHNMGKTEIKTTSKKTNKPQSSEKALRIEDLVNIAANRNSTKNDLTNAVLKVSKDFPFPAKIKGRVNKEGKIYLNFILLVASHRKADAKLVAFMNTELKKRNKEYSQEIDIYESEGIRQRSNRI